MKIFGRQKLLAEVMICIALASAATAQKPRSLDDIVNSANNPFKVKNSPKPTSSIETERTIMGMQRPAAQRSCVEPSAEQAKSCNPGKYLKMCSRSPVLAARNREFCEAYKSAGCTNVCRDSLNRSQSQSAEEKAAAEKSMTDYMKSLSGPTTNPSEDAKANCLKKNPGKRMQCGYYH